MESDHDHFAGHKGDTAVDPVCGMNVDPARASHTLEYNGQHFFFCSRSCLEKFQKEPVKSLGSSAEQISAQVAPTCDQAGPRRETITYTWSRP